MVGGSGSGDTTRAESNASGDEVADTEEEYADPTPTEVADIPCKVRQRIQREGRELDMFCGAKILASARRYFAALMDRTLQPSAKYCPDLGA